MNDEILELEGCDAPAEWRENMIFVRDGRGRIIELNVPDDMEVAEDVADD